MKIPLIKPYITDDIKKSVCDVLDSGYLTEGPITKNFEEKLKEFIGCDYLHAVTSATTGLEVALRALGVGPGDEVVYSQHGFLMYPISTRAAGATPVTAPETDLTANVDALLAAVTDKTRILFLANPNNPTGTYLPANEVARLRDGLRDDVLLVIDAAYAEYVERADYASGAELVETHDNVVMTRTFSKIYGLGSIRLGWAYCPEPVVSVLHRVRSPFNVNGAAQAAGTAAVRDAVFTDKVRAHNAKWLPWTRDRLMDLGLFTTDSVGNFVLVCFNGLADKNAKDADAFLKQNGIIVRHMASYSLPECLRITIGSEREMMAVVDTLARFLGRNIK